jgi:hypothetical protein
MGRQVQRKHTVTQVDSASHKTTQDVTWSQSFDPENEICFVALKHLSNGKYRPTVYALKFSPLSGLYWAILRLGHARSSKKIRYRTGQAVGN